MGQTGGEVSVGKNERVDCWTGGRGIYVPDFVVSLVASFVDKASDPATAELTTKYRRYCVAREREWEHDIFHSRPFAVLLEQERKANRNRIGTTFPGMGEINLWS